MKGELLHSRILQASQVWWFWAIPASILSLVQTLFYIQTFRCPLESRCLSFIVIKKSQRNISVLLAYCSRAETCHYRNDNRHKGTESSGHLSTETHQSNTGHPSSDPLLGSYTKIHVSQRLLQKQKYTRLIYIALFKTFSIQQVCGFHKI